MINTVITSAVLLGAAGLANAVGRAVVVNGCNFPVSLTNVPSSGGGQNQVGPETLNPGGSYSQEYTALTNGNGWSMKLTTAGGAGLLQYEYTYQNNGVIWFDLSAVNGDPFNGDWDLGATGSCDPKQTAYRFPTDDTWGMQSSCPDDSSVTVTLCNGAGAAPADPAPSGAPAPSGGAPDPHRAAPAPSVPAVPSVAAPLGSAPPAPSAPADPGRSHHHHDGPPDGFQQLNATPAGGNVKTVVVTQYVTLSPSPAPSPANKREEHLHRHARRHNHF